jgi:peptidyl-prolyl cis-trans isomerase B (cyclophilin B)
MAKNCQAEVTAAQADIDFSKNNYQLELDTTMGKIKLDMLPDVAPGHVKNMLGLAKIGYYDGLIFHRIINGFMIQGGCPEGSGMGGPGYNIKAEFNKTPHEAGVLSMARSGDPNSGGSQFFICTGKHTHLDGQYTAFGKTADKASLDIVMKIGVVPTDHSDKPKTPVKINKANVIATPKAA